MYLLIVNYSKPQDAVAPHVESHSAWVKQYFDEGLFLAAGPKKNKTGGVILAKSIAADKLQEIIAADSFVQANVATYEIIDMDCKLAVKELELLKIA